MPNYWSFRIDTKQLAFLRQELAAGRLRQGWGYHLGQDLRNQTYDGGAAANLPMLDVRAGDLILVPRLPRWEEVAIVRATEDWATGYRYQIDSAYQDYGHVFPAELLTSFARSNQHVSAGLRTTLRTPRRFWGVNAYSSDIELLLRHQGTLTSGQSHVDRLQATVEASFNEHFDRTAFGHTIYQQLNHQFGDASWENALVHGLQRLFPHFVVEHTGGRSEELHGTDILLRIPGLTSNYSYGVAIQVKDYVGRVSNDVLKQIGKASYWEEQEPGLQLIDRIVVLLRAQGADNTELIAQSDGVRVLFADDMQELLTEVAVRLAV